MKASSIVWNGIGLGVPLLLALGSIPVLVGRMGDERFGMLTLAWALLGYSSVFDLGVGRATTQYLAENRGRGRVGLSPLIVRTAISTTLRISIVGASLLLLGALLGVHRGIRASPEVLDEVQISLYIMCLILPLQAISATYRGVNEAFEKFRAISVVRALQGGANFVGPLVLSFYTVKLYWIVLALLLSRIVGVVLYRSFGLSAIRMAVGSSVAGSVDESAMRRRLLRFGGWATVSGVVSPLMVQADRFFIAGMLSASAVTAYSFPFEIVSQTLILVSAVTTAAFPALSRLVAERPHHLDETVNRWAARTGLGMTIIAGLVAVALPIVLPLWLGRAVSDESIQAGRVLCVGVVANSIAALYYARLHALGLTALTAKIHLLEIPVYLVMLVTLLKMYGIVGAAIAWSARMTIDAVALRSQSRQCNV